MHILPDNVALLCAEDLLQRRPAELAAKLAPHVQRLLQQQQTSAPERIAHKLARDILSASPEAFLCIDSSGAMRISPEAGATLAEAFHQTFEKIGRPACDPDRSKIQFVLQHPPHPRQRA